jgi:sec-independent protein translocase protein TatB
MIDFGLTKLVMIGAVALVVIGPERLPKVARMAGSLLGRAQRYINEVKAEVSREMELEELGKMHQEFRQAASDVQQTVTSGLNEASNQINGAWSDMQGARAAGDADDMPVDARHIAKKAREFRRKKLARDAVPSWYKQQTGQKTRVVSAAARVARHRPAGMAGNRTFFH